MLVGNLGGALEPVELIEPATGDCGSGSGISSRAIAGANDVLLLQIQSSNFALVNISAVITSGRRCSESMNSTLSPFAIKSDYAHGVASFNMFNFMPANPVARERIDNFNSLVEENHGRPDEYQEADAAGQDSPNRRNCTTGYAVIKKININKQANAEKSEKSENVGTRGPKNLPVTHGEIFSCERRKRVA